MREVRGTLDNRPQGARRWDDATGETQISPRPDLSRTATIAKNTLLVAIDVSVATVLALLTSIAVNRAIGPRRLGYFTYIQWLANTSALVAAVGLPLATRKYMAEYLGQGQPGIARAVFFASLRVQGLMALALVAVGEALVFTVTDPVYWGSSALMVLSQLPRMLVLIPSQANEAAERIRSNLPASLASQVLLTALILWSVWTGWDLVGIAAAYVVQLSFEFVVKMVVVLRWLKPGPRVQPPPELRKRMVTFWTQSSVLQLLHMFVWERSDFIFLRMFERDPRHLTFFATALNLTDRVLMMLRTFGRAVGVTLMAEYGRDARRLGPMTALSARYALLVAAPLLLGLAAVGAPTLDLLYGAAFLPAAPALLAAAVLAVPKPLLLPAQALLQAHEKQSVLVKWNCFCAGVNIALDLLLIPHFSSLGAALANGSAQALAILGIWGRARAMFALDLPLGALARILAAAVGSMCCAWAVAALPLPVAVRVAAGTAAGGTVYLLLVRGLWLLGPEDRWRLAELSKWLPGPAQRLARRALAFLAP